MKRRATGAPTLPPAGEPAGPGGPGGGEPTSPLLTVIEEGITMLREDPGMSGAN